MDPLHSILMPRIDPEELDKELNPSPTSSFIVNTSLIQKQHGVVLARLIVIIVRRYFFIDGYVNATHFYS